MLSALPRTPAGLADLPALWAALDEEGRTRIGIAALAAGLGMVGESYGVEPVQGFGAAALEGTAALAARMEAELEYTDLASLPRPDLSAIGVAACRGCGCTEDCACAEGCAWAEPGLCTACAEWAASAGVPE